MIRLFVGAAVALVAASYSAKPQEPLSPGSHAARPLEVAQTVAPRDRGSDSGAMSYYRRISHSGELDWDIIDSSCSSLVAEFLGRPELTCADLGANTAAWSVRDGVVGVRFFSPKISMFGRTPAEADIGWRSVVRVESGARSPARRARIRYTYFSFNRHAKFSVAIPDEFYNVQSILVRESPAPNETSAYWLAYDAFDRLLTSITATFDGLDSSMNGRAYYLPQVCLQCHGTNERRGFLNFLDVDAWFDRTTSGDDFAGVAPILPDAPDGPGSRAFLRVFDRIRMLNEGIESQNRRIGAPRFVTEAAKSWNDKHRRARLLPTAGRGVSNATAGTWDINNPVDARLLPLLNRYCYRCHSSRVFNVFDRPAVVRLKHRIESAVREKGSAPARMPRDRQLDEDTVDTLVSLIRRLR